MEDEFKNTVISLYKENKWEDILQLDVNSNNIKSARSLSWVWPSLEDFKFLKNLIIINNLNGLISIGCGCGLLEWMFKEYSKLEVLGYEINKKWWTSKYSTLFLELIYPKNDNSTPNSKYALLFCYFNDGEAFREYIENYSGKLIFIIGPIEGRGIHTNPLPFKPDFRNNDWVLCDFQEINSTKDFIAAYIRNTNT